MGGIAQRIRMWLASFRATCSFVWARAAMRGNRTGLCQSWKRGTSTVPACTGSSLRLWYVHTSIPPALPSTQSFSLDTINAILPLSGMVWNTEKTRCGCGYRSLESRSSSSLKTGFTIRLSGVTPKISFGVATSQTVSYARIIWIGTMPKTKKPRSGGRQGQTD